MRELFLVSSESTESSLVFRTTASPDDSAEQFFLAVDDELRATLLGGPSAPAPAPEADSGDDYTPERAPETPAPEASPKPAATTPRSPRPQKDPDPRLSAPMTMRPREIQDRVRGGTSLAELADEMGVTEARVEPFAHPVLLERARMAELAKQAHPVRDDGPARLTLAEVLATAFAARGTDPQSAVWDTYRDASGQWVIRVSWRTGHSDNVAEWTFQNHTTSSPTAVARNGVAADMTDPDFVEPVRSLTSVGSAGGRYYEDLAADGDDEDTGDHGSDQRGDDLAAVPDEPDESAEDELRRPEPEKAPQKRRRKAVTPHWEDVLLGVRTNTKRPKN